MKTDDIRQLFETMDRNGFQELEFELGNQTRLKMLVDRPKPVAVSVGAAAREPEVSRSAPIVVDVVSSKVGSFSFGKVRPQEGDQVKKGQVMGVISGLNMKENVVAPESGIVEKISIKDGGVAEFGKVLFRIIPG